MTTPTPALKSEFSVNPVHQIKMALPEWKIHAGTDSAPWPLILESENGGVVVLVGACLVEDSVVAGRQVMMFTSRTGKSHEILDLAADWNLQEVREFRGPNWQTRMISHVIHFLDRSN